ncbi:MAG: pentapeptide repeat-containing protein [Pseudomonadota bacterium]
MPPAKDERDSPYMRFLARYGWFLGPFWLLAVVFVFIELVLLYKLGWPKDDSLRAHAIQLTALLTILGALIAAPLAIIRVTVNERQARTAEEGLITDRITKAIEQLGAEKTVKKFVDGETKEYTQPNLEVRLGAIYALERISQDSLRDHIPIMETLCAYIRQNTNVGEAKDFPLGPFPDPLDDDATDEQRQIRADMIEARRQNWSDWLNSLGPRRPPRDDVAAILKVLSRRKQSQRDHEDAAAFHLNLARVSLQNIDLSNVDLVDANLKFARLEGANLFEARLEGANLMWAKIGRANLRAAKMDGTHLFDGNLEAAACDSTQIGISLLQKTDLTEVIGLVQSQLDAAIGDQSTKLPRDAQTGERLYVWSHWLEAPHTLDRLLMRYPKEYRNRIRDEWVKPNERRRKTGRDAETGEVYAEE